MDAIKQWSNEKANKILTRLLKRNMSNVMTPKHVRWNEFVERLEGLEGCNFHKRDDGEIQWKCAGGNDKSLARAILESMMSIDVDASLKYFESCGGWCDCEILFNVA